MKTMRLHEAADLCGGRLLRGNPGCEVTGLSTDSRTVGPSELFLALEGERFDGHDFIPTALEKGAAGVIARADKVRDSAQRLDHEAGLIAVDDTLAALHALAKNYRRQFRIPVVAVTGSCGKTTTKDMLAAILAEGGETLKTEGNLNNLIGAPLMLLRLAPDTRSAVIEIASNSPGEIPRLSQTVSPTAGIITSIGPVHLEGFGSIEGVMMEKCSLAANVSADGFMVINSDDIPASRISSFFNGKIITFGAADSADYFATEVRQDLEHGTEFLVNDAEPVSIPVAGMHNVLNALAAIAAARELGYGFDRIRRGLKHYTAAKMRMETVKIKGATVVNDAYNANPRAMRESISAVMAMPAGRKLLALGDMLELGEYAREAHHSLGLYVASLQPAVLYLVGDYSGEVRDGALEGGLQAERIKCCADTGEIAALLKENLSPRDLLLVKGSRGMQMERVIQLLEEN